MKKERLLELAGLDVIEEAVGKNFIVLDAEGGEYLGTVGPTTEAVLRKLIKENDLDILLEEQRKVIPVDRFVEYMK